MMKKFLAGLIALVLVILSIGVISPQVAAAGFTAESGERVVISEPVDGALTVSGTEVIVEGDVNGVLFAAGETVIIKGDVKGTIFAAGNSVTIEGSSEGEVFVAGNTVTISEQAELKRDLFAAGNQIWLNGAVGRDVFLGGSSTHIQNQVGRDARIGSNSLSFTENGQIEGDLFYQARQETANIDQYVQGEVQYQQLEQQPTEHNRYAGRNMYVMILLAVGAILSAMLIWQFLTGVTQGRWLTVSPQLVSQPFILMLVGLGILLLLPLIIVLTLISVLFTNIGVILSLLFWLLLFSGKFVAASAIGKYLIAPRLSLNKYNGLMSFTIAYIILYLIGYLPIAGWIISLLCIFYTVGLVFRETTLRFQTKTV